MTQKIYQRRRKNLISQIGDGIVIIATASVKGRNGDVEYPFRADSDFYYLTGFCEPESVAVICPGRPQGEYLIFCREKDNEREMWDGKRTGLDGVLSEFGADDAFPISDIGQILPGLMEERSKIYTNVGRYPDFDATIIKWLNHIKKKTREGAHAPYELVDLTHLIYEQRLIKSQDEIKLMKQAAKLSVAGHKRAMQTCQPGMYEYQVQAEMEYEFRKGGSDCNAYPSIVAGGANACVLHYTENNAELHDGDLLLIDAGAEYQYYASDITRTFPVNGKFSAEQKALYEITLAAQNAAFEKCFVGCQWNEPHDSAVAVITQGLIDEGLLSGSLEQAIETESYRQFYMHRTGHWLGMDVHDVGDYQINDQWREFETGMVLTVEPGIYVNPSEEVDERWHNIGIRIEDDVLIGKKKYDILTKALPKTVDDVEALMAG